MDEYLTLFKQRMKIYHDSEDELLKFILESSKQDVFNKIGEVDLTKDKRALELIFDRARYSYNDSSEYFSDNFQSDILDLGIVNAKWLEGDANDKSEL